MRDVWIRKCRGRVAIATSSRGGPLLGGFITTFLSWRVGFLLEVVVIAVVLLQIGVVRLPDIEPSTSPEGMALG